MTIRILISDLENQSFSTLRLIKWVLLLLSIMGMCSMTNLNYSNINKHHIEQKQISLAHIHIYDSPTNWNIQATHYHKNPGFPGLTLPTHCPSFATVADQTSGLLTSGS
ncbi:hypothetical protein QNI19_37050 [Cytophagaceae bacterium DM2B3-1]|uniref:Uncharacterized protein n=1 Tax=Xanthocytophaga flava TaxID=3048013 RepID=A0ABT7CXX5_9BACT|nr:hypothetical protein [Xanthocytophaga flavus]MDJ1498602.1 hypothetical protein [Xanthocytophaga flavus]